MHRGYFAVWRKIRDHELWPANEGRAFTKFEAWLDILMEAQYSKEPKRVVIKGVTLTQNYGEILRSTRGWAKRWGTTHSTTRFFLEFLKKRHMIRTHNDTVTTRITVINYKSYDPKEIKNNTVNNTHYDTQAAHTTTQFAATTKERKNTNKVKNKKNARAREGNFLNFKLQDKVAFLKQHDIFEYADLFASYHIKEDVNPHKIEAAFNQLFSAAKINDVGAYETMQSEDAWFFCENIINQDVKK